MATNTWLSTAGLLSLPAPSIFRSFVPRGLADGKRSDPSLDRPLTVLAVASAQIMMLPYCHSLATLDLPPTQPARFLSPPVLRTLFSRTPHSWPVRSAEMPTLLTCAPLFVRAILLDLCRRRLPLVTTHPCGICLPQLCFHVRAWCLSKSQLVRLEVVKLGRPFWTQKLLACSLSLG